MSNCVIDAHHCGTSKQMVVSEREGKYNAKASLNFDFYPSGNNEPRRAFPVKV